MKLFLFAFAIVISAATSVVTASAAPICPPGSSLGSDSQCHADNQPAPTAATPAGAPATGANVDPSPELKGTEPEVRKDIIDGTKKEFHKGSGFRRAGSGSFKREIGVTVASASKPLFPSRTYMRAHEIPPEGVGAYGLVVFQSKATPANRAKLKMVCNAFIAFFPRTETSDVAIGDQMVTIWPLDNPEAKAAKKDDCDFVVNHYDLNASQAAITDARRQNISFDGEGPYLVGWSPASARGQPDKLVLVIDMSADNSQPLIDQKFLFWKKQIVDDPALLRTGFSIENLRAAIRIFVDQYGQAMIDAVKLVEPSKGSSGAK